MSQSTYPLKAPVRPKNVVQTETRTIENQGTRKRFSRADIAGVLFSLGVCGFLYSLVLYITAPNGLERPFVASVSVILMALSNAFIDIESKPRTWRRP